MPAHGDVLAAWLVVTGNHVDEGAVERSRLMGHVLPMIFRARDVKEREKRVVPSRVRFVLKPACPANGAWEWNILGLKWGEPKSAIDSHI